MTDYSGTTTLLREQMAAVAAVKGFKTLKVRIVYDPSAGAASFVIEAEVLA